MQNMRNKVVRVTWDHSTYGLALVPIFARAYAGDIFPSTTSTAALYTYHTPFP
jgi:hypothetical protein